MDGPRGNNGDSSSLSEGGGESSAAGSGDERWTCEACGCNTNRESDRSCTICGTSRSDGTFRKLLCAFINICWFLFWISCIRRLLALVKGIMKLLFLNLFVTERSHKLHDLDLCELHSFVPNLHCIFFFETTNRSSNIKEGRLCRKGIGFVCQERNGSPTEHFEWR